MYPGCWPSVQSAHSVTKHRSASSMVVGAVGSFLANITPPLLEWARVDDAVGIMSCHVYSYIKPPKHWPGSSAEVVQWIFHLLSH